MFEGARNVVIEGGSFVVNVDSSKKVDVGQLFKMVARNAILNAGGRADEVGCFPGTREEVIDKVEKWMGRVENGSCKNRIMWLSGPAGAGKSAICQTIAECCPTRGQQAANFFFFRGDLTRNRAQPLVPTLVYQLRRFYPMLDGLLANCLIADPLICEASIEDQFLHLISSPMEAVHQSSSAHESIVLIIDGLDECDDSRKQDQIIIALRALVNADHSPFLVLIASRTEPHLIMSFNRLGTSVESIFLGDEYRPGDDIRRFVVAKFEEIKQVHHLRQMLSENWPAESDIDAITDKSSGQFIYAATVMRFILHSPESPSLSLVVILEMKTPAGHNPLAQLDAVYTYIFSKVHDIQQVKIILGAFFTIGMKVQCKTTDYQNFLQFIGYGPVEVKSLFSYLGAIIQIHTNPLKLVFYHASLHDYLRSKYRSLDYYLDIGDIATRISIISLKNFDHKRSFDFAVMPLEFVREPSTELSESLLDAPTHILSDHQPLDQIYDWTKFMLQIERLYFQKDRKLFKNLLQEWLRFAFSNNIEETMQKHMCKFALKLN